MARGSVLGKVLSLPYINDLVATLELPCFIFADDLKVVGLSNVEDLAKDRARAISRAMKWVVPLNKLKVVSLPVGPKG